MGWLGWIGWQGWMGWTGMPRLLNWAVQFLPLEKTSGTQHWRFADANETTAVWPYSGGKTGSDGWVRLLGGDLAAGNCEITSPPPNTHQENRLINTELSVPWVSESSFWLFASRAWSAPKHNDATVDTFINPTSSESQALFILWFLFGSRVTNWPSYGSYPVQRRFQDVCCKY